MNVIIFYTIIVLLIFSSIYLIYRINKLSKLKAELEYKNLILQLNPHFIFNSLTAIQNYILTTETQNASTYLSGLSRLIRLSLENSRTMMVTLDKEITFTRLFLEMQSIRFEGRFKHSVDVDTQIAPDLVLVPPMLIQPFINNIAEHGFIRFSNNGELNIIFKKIHNDILIEIEDVCFDFKIDTKVVIKSVEHYFEQTKDNVLDRINKLKRATGQNVQLSIDHLSGSIGDKKGMVIRLILPIK